MYNLDNLKAALMRRREAQKAYHDHSAKLMTDDDSAIQHDTLRRAYDDAAHSVAFHADIFMDAWEISTQLNGEQPALMLSPTTSAEEAAVMAYEDEMSALFWRINNAMAQEKCVQKDPECPNTGWPLPCSKCNYCSQNPDELRAMEQAIEDANEQVDAEYEKRLAENPDWLVPATEEDLAGQSSNSADLLENCSDWDDEDDWDGDEWYDDDGNWGPLDYDDAGDEEQPAHAILEPFGDGKCHCPYCNAECSPDYCSGCQSTLLPPAIKPEIRTDLPDEPPF